jgi:hypothetical protein
MLWALRRARRALTLWSAGPSSGFYSSGWRQRKPGNHAKSRSVEIHSLPDSIASAAR